MFEVESVVANNKAKAYLVRSITAENSALINKNYHAALLGNQQLANENTEALFRDRMAIFKSFPTETEVQSNFREAMLNRTKLDYLNHRTHLNEQILTISQEFIALNEQAMSVNRRIMEVNETIRQFNTEKIGKITISNVIKIV